MTSFCADQDGHQVAGAERAFGLLGVDLRRQVGGAGAERRRGSGWAASTTALGAGLHCGKTSP